MKRFSLFRKIMSITVNKPLRCLGYEIQKMPLEKKYKYLWLQNANIRTVIDIGANVGQFAKKILKAFPNVRVCSFEPIQDCYLKLSEFAGQYEKWEVFPFALGESDHQVEMFRSTFTPSSSLLKMTNKHKELFPYTRDILSEMVNVKRLDDIANTLCLEPEVLVKIDVQGFETQVIKGGQNVISQAKAVIIEVSFEEFYEEQSDFHTVYSLLHQLDFEFNGLLEQLRQPKTGLPIQADAIFTKKVLFEK